MKPVNKETVGAEILRLMDVRKEFGLSLRDEWLYNCLFELFERLERRSSATLLRNKLKEHSQEKK